MAATISGMWKKLAVLAIATSVITACAPATHISGEDCGGTNAGITKDGDALKYDQDADSTGNAWTCLLEQATPKQAVRYAITQDMEPGKTGMAFINETSVIYGMKQSGAVVLTITPIK